MKSYVLITGAAGGLGKAFATECASRGWDLFLTDMSEQSLAPLATGMQRLFGVETLYYVCDLTDPNARKGLWEHIAQNGLRFSMLINVAGLDFEGPFQERSVDELCAIVRLNVEATLAMTRQVLERRAQGVTPEQGASNVVFLASDPSIEGAQEIYWKNCRPQRESREARRPEEALRLWQLSERLCGITRGASPG